MTKSKTSNYEAPFFEVLELEVEQGFAMSEGMFGQEDEPGGKIEIDDWITY